MNVLIVEDEVAVAKSMRKTMSKCRLVNNIDIAHDYEVAIEKINSGIFDIVLVDIFLGENSLSGLDLCKYIKEKDSRIIVMIITGYNNLKNLERAFKHGANDYIRKPFNSKELELRVERWTQLSKKATIEKSIKYNGLKLDLRKNQFYYKEKKLPLTKGNKFLLRLFMENPEKLLTKEYVVEKFWGDYYQREKRRNLRSNIQSLRNSLESTGENWIKTVRGEGYILKKKK